MARGVWTWGTKRVRTRACCRNRYNKGGGPRVNVVAKATYDSHNVLSNISSYRDNKLGGLVVAFATYGGQLSDNGCPDAKRDLELLGCRMLVETPWGIGAFLDSVAVYDAIICTLGLQVLSDNVRKCA